MQEQKSEIQQVIACCLSMTILAGMALMIAGGVLYNNSKNRIDEQKPVPSEIKQAECLTIVGQYFCKYSVLHIYNKTCYIEIQGALPLTVGDTINIIFVDGNMNNCAIFRCLYCGVDSDLRILYIGVGLFVVPWLIAYAVDCYNCMKRREEEVEGQIKMNIV